MNSISQFIMQKLNLFENPVIRKEMRGRMRGWLSFVTITTYIALLCVVVSMIYLTMNRSVNAFSTIKAQSEIGRAIFITVFSMELLAVCFISPSLTAGAISSEREHQTYDLLRTSLLSARSLVLGKLISAIAFVLLIIIASIPLQSIALIFGGITPAEVLIGSLILILTAITVGALGLFFSSITRSTRTSTVLAQATTLIVIFGTPIFLLLLISVFDFQISPSQLNPFGEALVAVFGWFMLIRALC